MSAKRVDTNQPDLVALYRHAGCRVLHLHGLGKGAPDLLIGDPVSQRLALIEIKDGSKSESRRRLTPDEARFHAEWDGLPVFIVANDEDALGVLDSLREGEQSC